MNDFFMTLFSDQLAHNVSACDGRGLGGLSNAKHAKADQLYRALRDNAHKDNGSYKDAEPPPGTSTLLWADRLLYLNYESE